MHEEGTGVAGPEVCGFSDQADQEGPDENLPHQHVHGGPRAKGIVSVSVKLLLLDRIHIQVKLSVLLNQHIVVVKYP